MDGRIIDVEKGGVDGTSLQGTWGRRIALEQAFSKQMADRLVAKIGTPETGPQTGGGYFLRGTAFERADNPTKALEMYQKALSLDPQNQAARDRMESLLLKELQ